MFKNLRNILKLKSSNFALNQDLTRLNIDKLKESSYKIITSDPRRPFASFRPILVESICDVFKMNRANG